MIPSAKNKVYSPPLYRGRELPMSSRIINGRWFSNIYDPENPKVKIVVSLDAYANEKRKAQIALGGILKDMENGIRPLSARSRISKLKIKGRVSSRAAQVLRTHLYPFFGKYKPKEVTDGLITDYIEHRFGRNREGELQAFPNTINKELLVLQQLLQVPFGDGYRLPKIKFKRLKREIMVPLTIQQIELAAEHVGPRFVPVYWIMALTGLDIGDAINLRPMDFKDNWLKTIRGKTEQKIEVPVCPQLRDLLKAVPWPLDKTEKIFTGINSKEVSTNIRRAFVSAGLGGYGSKYLRRFIGSILLAQGCTKDWIAKMLSHAEGSAETDRYLGVYKTQAEEEFNKIKMWR